VNNQPLLIDVGHVDEILIASARYRLSLNCRSMNLAASFNTTFASNLASVGTFASCLIGVILTIVFSVDTEAPFAVSAQDAICVFIADDSTTHDGSDNSRTIIRYESQLTGFAEIDASGRQTQPVRVVTSHRRTGYCFPADHETSGGIERNSLVLKSPLALPIADSRPSLQVIEVRLQI